VRSRSESCSTQNLTLGFVSISRALADEDAS
jgi:hypothetical protein